MRFLANENVPSQIDALRTAGHDVSWIRLESPGAKDRAILEKAISEERILLTFDKDFGELAFREGLPSGSGVILFRVLSGTPADTARQVVESIAARTDWAGHLAVVERGRVRMPRLKQRG